MADSQQLMDFSKTILGFSQLGLNTIDTLSGIEDQAKQDQWRDFQMKRSIIDLKLEQTKLQQEQAIKSQIATEIASGMGNYKYGGNTADSLASYVKVHDWYSNNAQVRQMISTDPALFQAYNNLMNMGSGTLAQGMKDVPMPDGAGYPNLENIRLHPGDVSSLKDMMLVADRIPQYVEITQADGSKKTVDQRIMLYKQYGWTPESIGYDTATGRPSIVTPDEKNPTGLSYNIDANEASIRQRAQLMATKESIPFYNALSIVKLGDIGRDITVGTTTVKWADAVNKMKGGDAQTQAIFLSQSANPVDTAKRLEDAGIRVAPGALESASEMRLASGGGSLAVPSFEKSGARNIPASMSVKYLPSQIGGGALIQTQELKGTRDRTTIMRQMEDQHLMESLQAQGDLTPTFGKSGAVQSYLMRDAVMMDTPEGPKPVIRGDNARLAAKIANGQTLGEGLAEVVGVQTASAAMKELEPIMLGMNKKQGEATGPKVADAISKLEEVVPGIKTVVQNDPSIVAQIEAEENPKAKQFLVTTLFRDAYRTTYDEARGAAGEAVRALQAGASMAGEPVNVFADKVGAGDPAAVATMRAAQVDGTNASDVFSSAMDRASTDFAQRLSVYKTADARKVLSSIEGLNKARNSLGAPVADGTESNTYIGSQAEFMRGVADEMAKRPGISEVGFKNAAPDAAMGLIARLDAKVLSGIASKEESLNKMAASLGTTPDKLAVWWLGPGHTRTDLWNDFKQFIGK